MLLCIAMKNEESNVKIVENDSTYVRKGWIKCYCKWSPVRLIFHRCFEGFAAGNFTNFLYFFFNKTVCISPLD